MTIKLNVNQRILNNTNQSRPSTFETGLSHSDSVSPPVAFKLQPVEIRAVFHDIHSQCQIHTPYMSAEQVFCIVL